MATGLLNRTSVILLAPVFALLAATLAMVLGVIVSDVEGDPGERVRFFASAFFATGYGPAVAGLGAVAAIMLAAAFAIRNVLYYGVIGALIGLATSYSVDLSDALENTTDIPPIGYPLALGTASGIIGGLIFWVIAGRYFAKRPY